MQRVTLIGLCRDSAIFFEEDCLSAGGSNINADHIGCIQRLVLLSIGK